MPPQLLAKSEGPHLLLDKPVILIGRHQECDIQIASRKVSRKHCVIAQVNGHLLVRDLNSTNGIRINGKKVAEGAIKSGDELMIGQFRYEVKLGDSLPDQEMPTVLRSIESGELPVALDESSEKIHPVARAAKTPAPQLADQPAGKSA